jgi:hypothetical protein
LPKSPELAKIAEIERQSAPADQARFFNFGNLLAVLALLAIDDMLPTLHNNSLEVLMLANLSGVLAYLFVIAAVLLRVGAGTGTFATKGFSLVGASLLFFGSRIPRKRFWIPVALMIGSDLYLNLRVYQLPLALDQYMMWAWYVVPCLIGVLLRDRAKPLTVLAGGLGTGLGFYLASNFAVWAFGNIAYPHTLAGLLDCYVKAIPFARNGIISDVLFAAVFFGIGAMVTQQTETAADDFKSRA